MRAACSAQHGCYSNVGTAYAQYDPYGCGCATIYVNGSQWDTYGAEVALFDFDWPPPDIRGAWSAGKERGRDHSFGSGRRRVCWWIESIRRSSTPTRLKNDLGYNDVVKSWCAFCGYSAEHPLFESNSPDLRWLLRGCPECTMSTWMAQEFTRDEVAGLDAVYETYASTVSLLRPEVVGSVYAAMDVDPWTLDLLMLLYSHVCVNDLGLGLDDDVMATRVARYCDAGYLTVVRPNKMFQKHDRLSESWLLDLPTVEAYMQSQYAGSTMYGLAMALGEADAHRIINGQSWALAKDYSTEVYSEQQLRLALRYEYLAAAINATPLYDHLLGPFAANRYIEDRTVMDRGESLAALATLKWYREMASTFPDVLGPDLVIHLRQTGEVQDFVNTVTLALLRSPETATNQQLEAAVGGALTQRIAILNKTRGNSYRYATIAAGGIVATAGGLLGGAVGAVVGGVGAAGVSVAMEWVAVGLRRTWPSYFLGQAV